MMRLEKPSLGLVPDLFKPRKEGKEYLEGWHAPEDRALPKF